MSKEIIKVSNLDFAYNGVNVLNDINFTIDTNDYVAIVGPNGSGKTSLIKLLLGINKANVGDIYVDESLKMSYVNQQVYSHHKNFPITVFEVVRMGLYEASTPFKFYSKSDNKKVSEILKDLSIYDLKDEQMSNLSGGQRQRVLLARSIINNADILILDEPTSALDPEFRDEFYKLIEKLNNEGMTIIIVSHDLGVLGKYINKVMYIDHSIKFYGSIEDYNNLESEYGELV